jgi:hypothetical protein
LARKQRRIIVIEDQEALRGVLCHSGPVCGSVSSRHVNEINFGSIIVAFSTTAARPAKQATGTISIVGMGMADPVADGLVASLARPGGNVTGTSLGHLRRLQRLGACPL